MKTEQGQFPELPPTVEPQQGVVRMVGKPRLLQAERHQAHWQVADLDSLIRLDHPVRTVWAFVESVDLSAFTKKVLSVEGHAGRPAIDPAILFSLWLFAYSQGEGRARELERLCEEHHAYRWLCGGVGVNYHTLSDFRSQGEELDQLFAQTLAVFTAEGILQLERVAQDGMRVRASAGSSSFHQRASLEAHLIAAEAQIAALREAAERPQPTVSAREKAARERAARERAERLRRALELMPEAEAAMQRRRGKEPQEPRVSTTDPEARVMKMADGGFRPAFNVEVCADTATKIVIGLAVVNVGSDKAQMTPMLKQIEERLGGHPTEVLVDGGFTAITAIEDAAKNGSTVYAPLQKPHKDSRDIHEPRATDSEVIAAWRQRMGTEEAKEIYKQRASTIEWVNAQLRRFGLTNFWLRGLSKAKNVLILVVLVHNLFRVTAIRRQRAQAA